MTKNSNEQTGTPIRKIDPVISEYLEQMLDDDECVDKSAPADLSLNGEFISSAVFITNKRIIAFDHVHPDGFFKIMIEDVKKIEIETMYSNYKLLITTRNKTYEVIRFTNTVWDYIDEICRFYNKHYGSGVNYNDNRSSDEKFSKTILRCSNCGRPLRKKNSVCPYCIDKRKVINRLLSYIKPHKKIAIFGLIFSVLATSAALTPPYFTKILVDEVVLKRDLDLLWIMVAVLFVIYLIHSVFGGLRSFFVRNLSEKIIYDIRTQVFSRLQKLSLDYFDKRSTGAIMSRVSSDTQQLKGFIIQASQNVVVQILTVIIIGVIMFSMHWKLALITLLPIPFVTLGARYFVKKIHPIYHRVWRRRALMNAILGDSIPGIRVIKAFTGEDRQSERFNATSSSLLEEHIRAARMASVFTPAVSFFMMLGGVIIWGLGGYWVINSPDELSLGVLVAFISYAYSFFAPIQYLAGLSDMLQQATTSAERVFEILDAKPEPNLGKNNMPDKIKGELEFKNVTFYYEQDKKVLENINLKIRPGETIGIVGATGSGKSTFANLLLRFYDPVKGEILLDGTNINDIDIKFLRENIGFVLQEPLLFRDTIKNNISYSKPDATTDEIIGASIASNSHKFICDFPDAYDTRVGERGIGLSGGERQRVSIARAIIKNPSILILDEATSSVDTETEQLIQDAIDRLIENRTTVIIAHRLSTLRKADRIVVFEKCGIAEVGTHDDLMERKGVFYRLIKLQTDIGSEMLKFD